MSDRPNGLHAMILAAGRGERMRPLSDRIPKPLLPAGGTPLIIHHVLRLKNAGYARIVVNLAHLGEQIRGRLGDGSEWDTEILYSEEEQALETGGGIRQALPLLCSDPFLVINGDIWCDHPLHPPRMARHDLAHLVLVDNPVHNPEGDFSLIDAAGFAGSSAWEGGKPGSQSGLHDHSEHRCPGASQNGIPGEGSQQAPRVRSKVNHGLTFAGIGWYRAELFLSQPPGRFALAPLLREAMNDARVSGEHYKGAWMDIGTPERLATLDRMLSVNDGLAPVGPKT